MPNATPDTKTESNPKVFLPFFLLCAGRVSDGCSVKPEYAVLTHVTAPYGRFLARWLRPLEPPAGQRTSIYKEVAS